ncbi:NAD-dependent epimerase/dehydratase family protein [Flavobacteriaceae bacterium F89]|uniref:NAD-dependent epimerase/dehydratase family protein n=1 Tax=Cerina litoralis TaxID=2874477 RepID=A0AAE3ET40_9FLAO|nr:NAD-dependent epimerase/dehydratase family protein [Cerina litoralis]MCG2460677.1 NAD-dependent epimerase/dehydratase family protein [Cerina litoralis]
MVLVTGGTGLVGSHLLFHLANNSTQIKAIHRKNSNLTRVKRVFSYYTSQYETLFQKIVWVEADLNDITSLDAAFADVTQVYHCAAKISFNPPDFDKLQKVNVEGTANVVNMCLAHKVKKLCYVSSIATLGKRKGKTEVTEEYEWNEQDANVYGRTKYSAEMEVWRGSQEGLEVAIVNPGIIVGPGFWKTGSGELFKTAAKGRNYYPPSGTGFVAVHDVVRIMILLMESHIRNERFIAVGDNPTFKDILTQLATYFNKPRPKKKVQFWQLEIIWRLDWLWHFLSGNKRNLTRNTVESLRHREIYSSKKVVDQLQYNFQPLETALLFASKKFLEEHQ